MLAGGRSVRVARAVLRVCVPLLPMMLVLAASATGCEAIVGSSVPAFTCSDSDPSSCPSGQVCAIGTGQCIPASTSCLANPCATGLTCDPGTLQCVSGVVEAGTNDAGNATDSGGSKDTGPVIEGGGPPYAVGHTCQKPSDCATTLCADSATLGQDYFNQVGAVCTIPCCTSEQCGASLVCIGPGTGGKYCVPAAALKRTLGAKPGGTACAAATECRSGKCIGDSGGMNKVCADSCCLDAQCAGAAKCRPVDVEGFATPHKSYACSILPGGSTCSGGGAYDSCVSGVCASFSCSASCCSLATVTAGSWCSAQALSNGDTFNFSNGGIPGGGDFGATCTSGTISPPAISKDCKSGYCDKVDGATKGTCSDVCCTDNDCRPNVCRPRTGVTHFLRCVAP